MRKESFRVLLDESLAPLQEIVCDGLFNLDEIEEGGGDSGRLVIRVLALDHEERVLYKKRFLSKEFLVPALQYQLIFPSVRSWERLNDPQIGRYSIQCVDYDRDSRTVAIRTCQDLIIRIVLLDACCDVSFIGMKGHFRWKKCLCWETWDSSAQPGVGM